MSNEGENEQQVIVTDKIGAPGHEVPEDWLRARVRGWMNTTESPGRDFWIGTYTADGRWIYCSSQLDRWATPPSKQKYAMDVCKHLNRQCAAGGAWLVGWTLEARRFYLLWKDGDGDIQIPIDCDKPFIVIRDWPMHTWENMATAALGVWSEWHRNQEHGKGQQVKRAQGERTSANHLSEGLPVAGLT